MLHLGNVSEDILIHIASFLEFDDLWRLRQASVSLLQHPWGVTYSFTRIGLRPGSNGCQLRLGVANCELSLEAPHSKYGLGQSSTLALGTIQYTH